MARPLESVVGSSQARRSFATTHWSIVRAAGEEDSPEAGAALETLCRNYWHPVYAHVRLWGHAPEDARDLTQAFFAQLLRRKAFGQADQSRGRFRSFMLGSLRHFLHNAHVHDHAEKRGGGYTIVSWDQEAAEARLGSTGVDDESPDRIFERRWAETVLEHAATRLRGEFESSGHGALFEAIQPHVTPGGEPVSYADTAARLGTSIGAARSAAFRMRRQYQALIRDEVAQTLADPSELDDELRHLFALFASSS